MSRADYRDDTADQYSAATKAADLDLTAFQFRILAYLHGCGEDYGLGIKRALEEYYGTEQNHGRLYPNLDELVDHGLIAKSERDKRTNEYQLTELGRTVVDEELEHLTALAGHQLSDGGER